MTNKIIQVGSLTNIRWHKVGIATFGIACLMSFTAYLGYINNPNVNYLKVPNDYAAEIKDPMIKIVGLPKIINSNSPTKISLEGTNIPSYADITLKYSSLNNPSISEVKVISTSDKTNCQIQGTNCNLTTKLNIANPGTYTIEAYIYDKKGHIYCGKLDCYVNATQTVQVK